MPLEREAKFDVPEDFALPSLDIPARGIRSVDRGTHLLDAVYWDTASLQLLQHRIGLRHRTRDGVDGRWTLKGAAREAGGVLEREEVEVDGRPETLPAELRHRLPSEARDALIPVAHLRTQRHVHDLLDGSDQRWAELADDSVTVVDGDRVVATFREVEVEMTRDNADTLLPPILERLRAAGARRPARSAKYVRALEALGRLTIS